MFKEKIWELSKSQFPAVVIFLLINWMLFVCYPYPYVTMDSDRYVYSADTMTNNLYRPLGYPVFLAASHLLNTSVQAIPFFQSLFYLIALLYFIYSLNMVAEISTKTNRMLGILLIINPLPLFYTRHLLSDSIFTSLILFFMGSALRYVKKPNYRFLTELIIWSGLSLFVRHVGIICLLYTGIIITVSLKKQSWKHLVIFFIACSIIIFGICYKMRNDLGVFRLNTLDGWSLWSIAAPYINLEPEYRNNLESNELKSLYNYFALYPPDLFTDKSGLWHMWNKKSPAKRLLSIYKKNKQLNYHDAWIAVNDKLKLVSKDILINHIPEYISKFYLPSIFKVVYPDMMLGDTYWYGYYPKYPITPISLKSEAIKKYYNQHTDTWHARFDIFPHLKSFIDLWVRALTPICLGLILLYILFRHKLNICITQLIYITTFSFVLFYILGVTGMTTFVTRYLTPITPLLVTLNFLGLCNIFQPKFETTFSRRKYHGNTGDL